MCGFCGVAFEESRPVVHVDRIVERMAHTITHRGPDSGGTISVPFAQGGFKRLAIIDLAGGDQPASNADGSVQVFLNGEIYNYKELRAELERMGHRFRTDSDTEVLPHLYEEFGEGFIQKLNGMFAICICDKKARRVLIYRDRLGIKPMFYAETREGVVFGSELKTLLASDLVERELDTSAIVPYLNFFYVPGRRTLVKGVHKLLPGEMIAIEGGRVARRERYYDLQSAIRKSEQSAHLDELDALLEDATRLRLIADVPVAISLSGGLDSSLLAWYVSRLKAEDVAAISINFPEVADDSDVRYAKLVTDHLRLEHIVLSPSSSDFLSEVPAMVWHCDEPVADPAFYSAMKVAGAASERAKVLLSGTGADELFAGYGHHFLSPKQRVLQRLPGFLRSLAYRSPLGNRLDADKRAALAEYGRSRSAWHLQAMSQLSSAERDLLEGFLSVTGACEAEFAGWFDGPFGDDPLNQQLYADTSTYLTDQLLPMLDRTTMACSIEGRVPFLDHRVVELAFQFTGDQKCSGSDVRKALLKKLAARGLPPEILQRKKTGFPFGVFQWIVSDFGRRTLDLLLAKDGLGRRYLPEPWLRSLFASRESVQANVTKVYALLVLQIWHELFLNRGITDVPEMHLDDLFEVSLAGREPVAAGPTAR